MTYLRSLPEDAVLLDIFRAFPATARPLLDYHEALMRGPSPIGVAERELVAAYVSGVNGCSYCHGIHTATAQACGIPAGVAAAAVRDLDTAPVDDRTRALLRYADKLTRTPAAVTQADADAVLAEGWDDKALHDTVGVCALFNFMNRMVNGLGIRTDPAYFSTSGIRLRDIGYAGLAQLLDA
jgi:uncharacterized peroxidase-related enzyme